MRGIENLNRGRKKNDTFYAGKRTRSKKSRPHRIQIQMVDALTSSGTNIDGRSSDIFICDVKLIV